MALADPGSIRSRSATTISATLTEPPMYPSSIDNLLFVAA